MIREPGCFVLEKMMTQNHGKVLISFDPNIRPNLIRDKNDYLRKFEAWLKTIDILKASIADIKWLYETESMDEIARYFLVKRCKNNFF